MTQQELYQQAHQGGRAPEEKKSDGVSGQNAPEQKPVNPELQAPSINTELRQGDKDALELARKKAEAVMPYQDMENLIRKQALEYAPESEEDRKRRERRERSKRIIGAVTDGLTALSNLYFTNQYAPNIYNPSQSQLAVVNRWADKLKAEREARRDRYDALQGKLGQLGLEKGRTVREVEAALEAQKIARERARREEEEAKRRAKMFEPQYQEALSKAEGAGYDALTKKAAADAAPEQQALKTQNLGLQGQVYQSRINKNNRSEQKEFSAWDENGREYKFKTKEAAESFAKQHGTWQEVDQTTETMTDSELNGQTTKTETKKGGYPKKPSKGTMPGVRTNDNNKMPGVN